MTTTTTKVKPKKIYGNELKLRQVQVIALLHPKLIHMESWVKFGNGSKALLDNPTTPECGSTGCLAGLRVALDNGGIPRRNENYINLFDEGMESFEITEPQAKRLFYTDEWPVKFRKPISKLTNERHELEREQFSYAYRNWWSDEQRAEHDVKIEVIHTAYARVVAERVEHFINTGR